MLLTAPALPHEFYHDWINQRDQGCCNKQDCADANDRVTADGNVEVQIEGKWCPVKPHHWLKSGTPDPSSVTRAHACVCKGTLCQILFDVSPDADVCDRLICYEGRRSGS